MNETSTTAKWYVVHTYSGYENKVNNEKHDQTGKKKNIFKCGNKFFHRAKNFKL